VSCPPRLPRFLLRLAASRERNETYLGDIEELYRHMASNHGQRRAQAWFWKEAIVSLPAGFRESLIWSFIMWKNYLMTAARCLLRRKGYTFLNITGLALGMAGALLIWAWVQHELGFDRFHKNAGALYRVEQMQPRSGGRGVSYPSTPYPMGPALEASIPDFTEVTRVGRPGTLLVQSGETGFYEDGLMAVDPAFLRMFTFPLIRGRLDSALAHPFTVVISQDMADKFFPGEDPVGQVLTINQEFDFAVSGVMRNPPQNSTLRPQFLVPLDHMEDLRPTREYWPNIDRWDLGIFQTWVQLPEAAAIPAVAAKIGSVVSDHTKRQPSTWTLAPLTGIRYSQTRSAIFLFSGLAFFVLLVACINFMNLSTARAANRAPEIGLRKVVGAVRRNIVSQFYGETVLTTLLAVLGTALLTILLFPLFRQVTGTVISPFSLLNLRFGLGALAVVILTGLMAGSYPALFLSGLRPVSTLKGRWRAGARSTSFRRVLVVFQFGLSALLLISTGIIYRQVEHMRTLKPGYDKDHLIYMHLRFDAAKTYPVFKRELRGDPLIPGMSASFQLPMHNTMQEWGTRWEGRDPKARTYVFYDAVDFDYVETLGLKLAAGRAFSERFASDRNGAFLVNQTMLKQMDCPSAEAAVGRILSAWRNTGPIVGVLEDYQFQNARNVIEPQVIALGGDKLRYAVVRLRGGRIPESLDRVRAAWKKVNPAHPFEYRFFDEAFDIMYRSDRMLGTILQGFSLMGVLIACIGLFGLASFSAEQRRREIGVRRVLGASVGGLAFKMTREFIVWVAVANVLAWPAAFFLTDSWVRECAHRPGFGWWVFLAAAVASIGTALLTVGFQTVRAARTDPVQALKDE
jgi:putative ABC transport system permease protein